MEPEGTESTAIEDNSLIGKEILERYSLFFQEI
jgi:hypothetical protein